jgi:membrane protein required for colicin V production
MSLLKELTILDWVVLIILMGSIVSSILKGFARETSSAGAFVAPYVKTQDIASLVGFALIFFGILLLGAAISLLVNHFLQAVHLKWFDRFLGAAFGFVRGWIIGAVLFLILTAFPVQIENVRSAKFAPYLLAGARVLVLITPSSLKTKFLDGYRRVQECWKREVVACSTISQRMKPHAREQAICRHFMTNRSLL